MKHDSLDRLVDQYIENVLRVVEQLEQEQPVPAPAVHDACLAQLEEGREKIGHSEDWEPVAYALAAWTDELLLELPWQGRSWWNDNVLEAALFGTRLCSERFFVMAKQAARDPSNGVLRVFHDCVLLGFRGIYSLPEHGRAMSKELSIPPTLELWLNETQERLASESVDLSPAKRHRSLSGAAPHDERRSIVWWSVAASMLFAINVTVYCLFVRPTLLAS